MEKIRQNIFGIGEVYELQKEGQWVEKNRESYREFGYVGGGVPGPKSAIDRIDYSNDTVTSSVKGLLASANPAMGAAGNSNFGYFGGGFLSSRVDRTDYSNDSQTVSVRGPLSLARFYLSATGNSNFGYFGGGRTTNIPATYSSTSIVDRINYSNDLTIAIVRGPLSLTRGYTCAGGNSNFGYFAGGRISSGPTYYSTIDRTNYSNDTLITSVRGPLTIARDSLGFTENSSYGWLFGGTQPYYSRIERIDYSNDLVLPSIRTVLSSAKSYGSAIGNSNFGFYTGGYTPSVGSRSTVERIDYANDTNTPSIRGPLSSAKYNTAATSSASFGGSPVSYLGAPWVATTPFGYFGGGSGPASTTDRIDYTNDTNTALVRGPLSSSRVRLAAAGNSNFGYFIGGIPGPVSTVDRIDYSNDLSVASVRGSIPTSVRGSGATGNSNFGYFGNSPYFSTVYRIDYNNDTSLASTRGPLASSKGYVTAVGNSNFGYFGGGSSAPPVIRYTDISRIDYSNDSSTASIRGPLSLARTALAATGNSNFGYFGAGGISGGSSSTVDRIDYSNDTQTASLRGPLSSAKSNIAATGNNNFAYFGGSSSTVDRIDYSNDTQTASLRGPLSSARYGLAASSSQAYGGAPNTTTDPIPTYIRANTVWNDSNTLDVSYKRVLGSYGYWSFFGGAYSPPFISTTERIDYANDTTNALSRGGMNIPRGSGSMFGNSNFGYTAGGRSPGNTSIIERIDYSNDSSIQTRRGDLGTNQYRNTATNSESHGYNFIISDSRYQRISFANDLVNASYRGRKSTTLWHGATSYNKNYAYYAAGIFSGGLERNSIIDRIDFSNDDVTASVRGKLTGGGAWHMAGVGNANFGYYIGGYLRTNIDRLNYSNDLTNTSLRSNAPGGRFSGNSNLNYGYFGGGGINHKRLDFANDTEVPLIRGALSASSGYVKCTTNARNS